MEFLYLFTGLALGFLIAWLLLRNRSPAGGDSARTQELDRQNAALKAQLQSQQGEQQRTQDASAAERKQLQQVIEDAQKRAQQLGESLATRNAEYTALEKKLNEQRQELDALQKKLVTEFENLANRIFEEKSQKFTEQNRSNLDILLKPLGEQIKDFEKKVNEVYVSDTKERASLKEQILQLHQLNQQMSKDAQNLTKALKGESKTQGSWGEIVLENILEKSGLVRDREFTVQSNFQGEDGRRLQPDVIIHLPEDRHIVIDSKVALVAYERYSSAENETEQISYAKEHTESIRRHIRQLSDKRYQDIYGIKSPDYVLLFIANEPAFYLAMKASPDLFNEAIERDVIIVTPTTLLGTLRMVAHIWRQEYQNRNVLQIANEAASMYDKFAGFIEEMVTVGKKLDDSKKSYEIAMGRLYIGPGNVVKRIENLKALGLKVNKSLPPELLDKANENEQAPPSE
ncbi:MAG: hypothetical protein FD123_4302 [Bacteroidetes bacterium]|nr:MAG: hypothetical protein FD123_4302 [Bacteroidota bacterium]